MARFGLCGGSYPSQSVNADGERTINWIPELIESANGKSGMAMYPSPGLAIAYNLGATAILGTFMCQPGGSSNDRLFAVVQNGGAQVLYELFADNSKVARGNLAAPTTPNVYFSHNGTQLIICTGGQVWLYNLVTNAAPTQVGAAPANVVKQDYDDGFFVALIGNSNTLYTSALLDGSTWPALSKAVISEFPDNIVSIAINQRIIYVLGRKQSVAYANAGNLNFPFSPINGIFVEGGCGAANSVTKIDNSVMWIDADERGGVIARRVQGITPARISNHAIEQVWASYPTVADAIAYAFQDRGHTFWHIYFPSGISADGIPGAGASWRYDVSTEMWHEVAYWNAAQGHYEAHHSQNHAYAFGKHFVGDWESGTIYQMSIPVANGTAWSFADDAGNPIRRLRRAPVISKEDQWIFHKELQIDLEAGLGPQPGLAGSLPPTVITLADALGNLSNVKVNDAGNLTIGPAVRVVQPATIILNDPTNARSWLLGIESGGPRGTDSLEAVGNYPTALEMTSASGLTLWNLMVSLGGNLETAPLGSVVRDPQLMLRWSDDGGHTWSNFYPLDCGQAGKFKKRATYRRLGRSRNRVYEITCTDPIPWRIVDGYLKASGYQPTERLTKQLAKQA